MPLFRFTRAGGLSRKGRPHSPLPWIALIALLLGAAALGFAWLAGWIGHRLTAQSFTDSIEATGPAHPGFRRAHSKGVCVSGYFQGTPEAAALSRARVFAQAQVPVLGRLSIGGGDPHGADNNARVRSMALQLSSDDSQQWRMAMNSFPFFAVPDIEAFHEQTRAQIPDPATGKPDPAKLAAILEKYPSARAFRQWAQTAPWPDSWANTEYNSVNSFWLVAADGTRRAVRWQWQPQTALEVMDEATRTRADADFLTHDLQQRLAAGPVRWNLVLTLAGPQDDVDDPSVAWPAEREQVQAGVLTLQHMQSQEEGACGELNFDPLILPTGIERSNDGILAARSAIYSQSFNRREHERASGQGGTLMRASASGHFNLMARLLHWSMAVMIVAMLLIGVSMVASLQWRPALLDLHRPLGAAIFVLALLRLFNRLRHPPPALPSSLPAWQVLAAKASHMLLYALMLSMPLVGWAMLSAGGYPIVLWGGVQLPPIVAHTPSLYSALRNAHSLLAYVLFATVLMHVGAALFHAWVRRDGVFSSMARGPQQ